MISEGVQFDKIKILLYLLYVFGQTDLNWQTV